ncbi:MAG: hypothetical protein ABSB35_32090 [Bryobacteraceae bacterium]
MPTRQIWSSAHFERRLKELPLAGVHPVFESCVVNKTLLPVTKLIKLAAPKALEKFLRVRLLRRLAFPDLELAEAAMTFHENVRAFGTDSRHGRDIQQHECTETRKDLTNCGSDLKRLHLGTSFPVIWERLSEDSISRRFSPNLKRKQKRNQYVG